MSGATEIQGNATGHGGGGAVGLNPGACVGEFPTLSVKGARRLFVLVLALVGCEGQGEGAPESAGGDVLPGPAAASSGLALEAETRRQIAADSLLGESEAVRLIASLQTAADSASDRDVAAPALLRLGLLKLRLFAWDAPESVLASRPQDYFFNEIAGSWLYQGLEFTELTGRYPDHVLADDAAYAATELPLGGECEGRVDCYLWAASGRLVDFLEAYPGSPLGPVAVQAVNRGYQESLAEHPDLSLGTELYDPVEVRTQLERYEAVVRGLPDPSRQKALTNIAALWRRFGEEGRARGAERGEGT